VGGFFGIVSNKDCVLDVFYGVDYHSHLGTRRAGLAAVSSEKGFQRDIHNIENAPFRTKFSGICSEMSGNICIGCISDSDPQPLLVKSRLGVFAICITGRINNADYIVSDILEKGHNHFEAMTGGKVNSTEITAALIATKDSFAEGIRYAQEVIEGSASILIMTENSIIVARDKLGRTPVHIGKNDSGYCASFESFAYQKLGYEDEYELGPGETVECTFDSMKVLTKPGKDMRICAFLWTYYGYSNSCYENVNVETMRTRNGGFLAEQDEEFLKENEIDSVSGVPDSGTPYAIGYANKCSLPFTRPFIKYTPTWARSFMPSNQAERNRVAEMKIIPVHDFIVGKRLMLVDDSIVRGTQLKETVDFLYDNGAKNVHMRSACPPYMYTCKYLCFSQNSSQMDLIARKIVMELEGEEGFKHLEEYSDGRTQRGKNMRKAICEKLGFESLEYQSVENLVKSIGIDPCKVCTYCWTGKE